MEAVPVAPEKPPEAGYPLAAAAAPAGAATPMAGLGLKAAPGVPPASAFRGPPLLGAGVAAAPTTSAAAAGAAAAAASAVGASHLTKKIQKGLAAAETLAHRVNSQPSRDALKCLSEFFEENSVQSRRNLRTTIEGRNLLLHQEFVQQFDAVERSVSQLDKLVNALDTACDRAGGQLRQSKADTQVVLEKASALRQESKAIEQKQEVLGRFLERFRLSEADTQLVRSGDAPLDEEFFCAFERLEQVRKNARQLLNTCGQQTSGVDILHETSEILEASYERMFIWVQQQCRGSKAATALSAGRGSGKDSEDVSGVTFKRVLALLVERPVYFNHCIRDISRVRRQVLVQRFFDALSQGDGASGARPIELQASDPVRYVGDMLAWIHENAAAELEALRSLTGAAAAGASAAQETEGTHAPEHGGSTLVALDEILDFTLEGLVAPFTNRVKQVLGGQTAVVVVYKIAQIFTFFAKTLEEVLKKKDVCLVTMCRDLYEKIYQAFLDMFEKQAQRLRQGVAGVYVTELGAPPFVLEAVNTLSEVLVIYENAPVPAEEREADFLPILSAAFDPLLNHCQQVAAMMDAADGQVFLINCVAAMQAPLRKHEFTAQRVAMYTALLEDHMRLLVEGQAAAVLAKVGLAERLQALRLKPQDAPLSSVPELHPVGLAATLRSFYNSLFTLGGALALPVLERIGSKTLRAEARSGVAQIIAASYEELHEGVKELGVATHTPEQVRTLLE